MSFRGLGIFVNAGLFLSLAACSDDEPYAIDGMANETAEPTVQISSTELNLSQDQKNDRSQVRREMVGRVINLSGTKGDAFRQARILAVTKFNLRVSLSSGTQIVPLSELPQSVREELGMSADEAAVARAKTTANVQERAEKWKRSKAGKTDRAAEDAIVAILQLEQDKNLEIEELENGIQIRLQEMADLKSKASGFETKAFKMQEKGQSGSAWLNRSEVVRAEAEALKNLNTQSWGVIAGIKTELEELKKRGGL